jgi:hypothetical protein
VKCRSCGHEIAENAIVCYRCGTPTAGEPPARPSGRPKPRGVRTSLVVAVIVALLAAAAAVGLAWHLL